MRPARSFWLARNPQLFTLPEEFPLKKPVPHDKYFLRSLHQEIDLYDRKLAYLDKYAQFDSAADREGAENKLSRNGRRLRRRQSNWLPMESSSPSDLPRSFRAPAETCPAR